MKKNRFDDWNHIIWYLKQSTETGIPIEFNSEGMYVHAIVGWDFRPKGKWTCDIYEICQLDFAPFWIKRGVRFEGLRHQDGAFYSDLKFDPYDFCYPYPKYRISKWPNNEVV